MTLHAAIDQEDTNWIVVLKDVGPDVSVRTAREGERNVPSSLPERELTRGWLKASYRALDLDYLDVGAMARFFDAKKQGDLQKQATTESDSFSQIKTQIYANVEPRFEKAAALHQSNQVLALTTAILLFKLGLS